MSFDSLRINDYVRFHPKVMEDYMLLHDSQMWEDEPSDCFFQITKYENRLDKEELEIECVKSCGRHYITDFTRDGYEEMESLLGVSPLIQADSLSEFADLLGGVETKPQYNFEDDVESIIEYLTVDANSRVRRIQ